MEYYVNSLCVILPVKHRLVPFVCVFTTVLAGQRNSYLAQEAGYVRVSVCECACV